MAAASRVSSRGPSLGLWATLCQGLAEPPQSSANLVPGQCQEQPRGAVWTPAEALGSLDGFFEGRSSQLLKRDFFPLPFCLLPGKVFFDSAEMEK